MSIILEHTKALLGYDKLNSDAEKALVLHASLSKNMEYAKVQTKLDPAGNVVGYSFHDAYNTEAINSGAGKGFFPSHYWTVQNSIGSEHIKMLTTCLEHLQNGELRTTIAASRKLLPMFSEITNATGKMGKANVMLPVEKLALFYIAVTTPCKFTYSVDAQTTTGVYISTDNPAVMSKIGHAIKLKNDTVVKSACVTGKKNKSTYPRPSYWYCSFLENAKHIHNALYGTCVIAEMTYFDQDASYGGVHIQHVNTDRMLLEYATTRSCAMLQHIQKDKLKEEFYNMLRSTNKISYAVLGGKSADRDLCMSTLNAMILDPTLDNLMAHLSFGLNGLHPFYKYIIEFIAKQETNMQKNVIRAIREMAQTLNNAAYINALRDNPNKSNSDVNKAKAKLLEELVSSLRYSSTPTEFLDNLGTRTQRLGFSLPPASADVVEALLTGDVDLDDMKKIMVAFMVVRSRKSNEGPSEAEALDQIPDTVEDGIEDGIEVNETKYQ